MHTRHALLVALAVLAVPLAGALPQQAAPQAHTNTNTHAGPAPVAGLPAAAQDAADDAAIEANETGETAENASVNGPEADLPAHVPDHVQRSHTLINQFLEGALDRSLGPHLSSVARPGNGR